MTLAVALSVLLSLSGCGQPSYRAELEARVPMQQMATTDFALVYPALAEECVEDYGITAGRALDVGGGPGQLSIELARDTELTVYLVDIDPWAVRLAALNAQDAGLASRVRPLEGDALALPFRDQWFDLVVSRGSIFFWDDQLAGLLECWRVLAPGGVARIGGGFSTKLAPEVRQTLVQDARARFADGSFGWRPLEPDLTERLEAAGVQGVRLIQEPDMGWWIEMRRPVTSEGGP